MSSTLASSIDTSRDELQEIKSSQYKIYTYNQVKYMTDDFETLIGESSFSKIYYKGYRMGTGPAAVKIFKNCDDIERSFLKESKNMRYISHPNVIAIHGICYEQDLCILSDFMANGSLQDLIDKNPKHLEMDRSQMIQAFIILCKALQDFHGKNYFHLDIKPSNILFDQSENPKYADFNGSYFFDKENTNYMRIKNGHWSSLYMDPCSIALKSFGYYTDIYAFGMTLLAVLTKRKNIEFMLRDGRDVFKSKNVDNLKKYFTEEWHDEIGIRLLSCALDCTKDKLKERICAKNLARELEKIKYQIDYGQLNKEISKMNIEHKNPSKNIPEVPCILMETREKYNSSKEFLEKLKELAEKICDTFHITEEEVQEFHFAPPGEEEEEEEDQQLGKTFICYKIVNTNEKLGILFKLSRVITFCNLESLDITDGIYIHHDVILKSNNNLKLNVQEQGYIEIEGQINVEMTNFKIEDCERLYYNTCYIICLSDRANLTIKDVVFRNNINESSIIGVDQSGKLNMQNCIFDGNKKIQNEHGTCIDGWKESRIILKDCTIRNHGGFGDPYETSDFLLASIGHVLILNCTFENNISDTSSYVSFLFEEEADVTILNSTFRKCSYTYFCGNSKGILKKCRFKENGRKDRPGGALCLYEKSEVVIEKCDFFKNIAIQGGGLYCSDYSKFNIKESTFDGNKTFQEDVGDGGAMLLNLESSGKLKDCRFLGNNATRYGGALSIWRKAKIEINRCYFEKNLSLKGKGNSIYGDCKSNVKEMIDNVYIDSPEDDKSNVYIDAIYELDDVSETNGANEI